MPPAARQPALLLVDVQEGFDDPAWGPRNNPDAERRIAEILEAWRRAAAPVMHIHHASPAPDGLLRAGTAGHAPKPAARPAGDEPIYVKSVNSAFIGTTLEADLRRRGLDAVVIVGLTTNHCVSTTARMAANLGFATTVVSDATATFDRLGLDGRIRPAAEVHAAALSDLWREFAEIVDTETLLARPWPSAP
ncbi:MAG TPA: cysteine hydrolase family protein [Phenylobacterium sp.]|jgi:nicotinamidase-related amidase